MRLNRVLLIAALLVVGLAARIGAADDGAADDGAVRRNVLLLIVDDLRTELGCYGAAAVKTPNMDRLAASSLRFDRAYCQCASCGPSRASLLTGRRPDATQVFDNRPSFRAALPDAVTLPELFKRNGYHTRSIGKVFHGIFSSEIRDDPRSWSVAPWRPRAVQYRTEEGLAVLRRRYPKQFGAKKDGAPADPFVEMSKRRYKGLVCESPDVDDDQLIDGAIAAKAVAVLDEIKQKPFFLAVGFVKPHAPFVAPKKYFDWYDENEVDLSALESQSEDTPELAHFNSAELRGYEGVSAKGPLPPDEAKRVVRAYRACVSYVDAQIGRVLDELDRLDLRENTIIVLLSDHGYHLGHDGLWCKNTDFETALRTPLLVSTPEGTSAGKSTDGIVELVDLYPTLCDLCQIAAPDELEGTSFRRLIESPDRSGKPGQPGKKAAFGQHPRANGVMERSVRTERHRLTRWFDRQDRVVAETLYDYETPQGERRNVVDDPSYQTVRAELAQMLEAIRRPMPGG